MPRKAKPAVRRASSATTKTTRKRTTKPSARKRITKPSPRKRVAKAKETPEPQAAKPKSNPPAARPVQRTSDVPIDLIAEWYTPKQTSLRASFRSDGADLQSDQEIPIGDGDGFQDEDHFTNKSGDARIGTHGRVYQQSEARTEVGR
ncbi:MAG: hypothetical protein ACRD3J_13635 [Thermoanaerobaculia bacterium]